MKTTKVVGMCDGTRAQHFHQSAHNAKNNGARHYLCCDKARVKSYCMTISQAQACGHIHPGGSITAMPVHAKTRHLMYKRRKKRSNAIGSRSLTNPSMPPTTHNHHHHPSLPTTSPMPAEVDETRHARNPMLHTRKAPQDPHVDPRCDTSTSCDSS
ncbi:hypothetical protein H257_11282 [Aphanomyces astaci]|uniref:Uncharacterized protein n=1 Tax=Aphanomyces astaci TaxID=112090 RepID=W4G3V6_APHAT|nr:hypothetical protein H257_11282 [Aphanomyces astaci]ETV73966.1 hypothetical protein H257_11282 [Aphanomyces astaci]|eukprot:XP_009836479.1 hypothetical protein H257_11282 [Aphanomyces astaci]